MRYQSVEWLHARDDDPVVLHSEIDGDGWEVCKVDEYRNGRLDSAEAGRHTGTTWLSTGTMPNLDEINALREFRGQAITADQFAAVWRAARR